MDLATSVEHVLAGPKLYCKAPQVDPGGGGVNVARAIRKMGGNPRALVAVGGASGQRLQHLLAEEAVAVHPVLVGGETRESLAVTDESSGAQYRFSLPGQILTETEGKQLLAEISGAVSDNGFVVLSGGVAPGLGDDFPQQIQAAIAPRTERLIVDTSKGALARLIAEPSRPLHILRLDQREAEQSAGHALRSAGDSIAFAESLIDRGVAHTIVTSRQAEGSILVTQNARYVCRAPQVTVVSKVGAGDSFVGALTLALFEGAPPQVALQWGVAAAAATMGTEGTAFRDRGAVEALVPRCHLEEV